MTDPILTVANLKLKFSGLGLSEFNFAVNTGQTLYMIGSNGIGKTQMIRAILGIGNYSGDIQVKPGTKIGYVPQKFYQNILLPIDVNSYIHLERKLDLELVDFYLQKFDILKVKTAQLSNLSGGQLQKVLLTKSLAMQPDLLILDEPLTALDLNGQKQLIDILTNINCTQIIVSHDLHSIMSHADQVLCLEHNKITDSPSSVSKLEPLMKPYRHDH